MKLIITSQNYKNKNFNLTIEGSDFGENQIVLQALIGTLVKYGPTGKIIPYLASSWEVSDDKKKWRFRIRENLKADDGTEITAQRFYSVLLANLKRYSERSNLMGFDTLIGWDSFSSNKTDFIEGFISDDNHIEFSFKKRPDHFLELLQMPYFGLWIENERNEIISTAAYRIKSLGEEKVKLSLRDEWFSTNRESFKEIEITFGSPNINEITLSPYTIVQMPYEASMDPVPNAYWVQGTPTIIDTFVLSPYKEGFFNNPINRSVFLNRIKDLPEEWIESKFFYPTAPSEIESKQIVNSYQRHHLKEPLTFALERTNYQKEEIKKFENIISHALIDAGVDFVILPKDEIDRDWYKKTDSNKYFDARISSVAIGDFPLLSAIKMMFCTTLGVSFPDKGDRICQLVEEYENSESDIDHKFIKNFNQIIHDQAIIIPIKHNAKKWLITKDILPKSFPATSPFLMFEQIEHE